MSWVTSRYLTTSAWFIVLSKLQAKHDSDSTWTDKMRLYKLSQISIDKQDSKTDIVEQRIRVPYSTKEEHKRKRRKKSFSTSSKLWI